MKYFPMKIVVLAAALYGSGLLIGCGGDEKKAPPIEPFLGEWSVSQASVKVSCTVIGDLQAPIMGSIRVTRGQGTALAMTFTDPALAGCTLGFNVQSATVATPASGQSCVVNVQGIMATFTATSGTFGVVEPTASVNLTGNATGALNVTCTGKVIGTLNRGLPADAAADAS